MEQKPSLITGDSYTNHQGKLSFINDFDMAPVKRVYRINHRDTAIIRGWRAHRVEQRWFYASYGSFKINIIKIDDWNRPANDLEQTVYILNADDNRVLHIPKGYATAIQALQPHSELTIFADSYIEDAKNDDHLFPLDYWKIK